MTIADDVAAQTEQVFRNIAAALQQADASLDDVVRVTYYLTDASYFEVIAPICGRYFAKARPAATALICKLIDPAMKIEIEVRSEEHTSELQSLMRISYAVFCLKKQKPEMQ